MIFDCDKCGLCCKHLELIPELREYDSGNGRCVYLLDNNLCSIYESRPDICNVAKMYENVYYKEFCEEEYLKLNYEICKMIKEELS